MTTVGPQQRRSFTVQIRAHEFCGGAEELDLDDFVVRAYSPTMIAVEKYRAICQQHPDYTPRAHRTARARDFFDIHSIANWRSIDLGSEASRSLFQAVFAAKRVPLALILPGREPDGHLEGAAGGPRLGPSVTWSIYDRRGQSGRGLRAPCDAG